MDRSAYKIFAEGVISGLTVPNRWRAGIGKRLPECVSCNSCIYAMIVHPGKPEPGLVACICKGDKQQHHLAQKWLATWQANLKG
jgi:hypothetical protein